MKHKKILVTGGAGFIGSHLVKRLLKQGAELTVTVKYKSRIDNVRLSSVWQDVEVIEADLRNIDSLKPISQRHFDSVFHLAAYNHVGDSFIHFNESLMSNTVATANLLENVHDFGCFIYTSTSEVYGFQHDIPFEESNTAFPISPYAVSKYAGELYARMKQHQTGAGIFCVRPFNTFGPYQSEKAIIPELIIKCLRGERVETTEGKQTREFNYVENIIDGFIAIAGLEKVPELPINIGSGQEIAICDLVRKIHELTEADSELAIGALPTRPTEIWRMQAANQHAKEILQWSPKVSFEDGLRKTIAWYKNYLSVFQDKSSPLQAL